MFIGSALRVQTPQMTELLSSGLVSFMFSTQHCTCVVGEDVALLYPIFHFVLITVTALSGIYVKSSSDVVGRKCIMCVSFV